MSENNFTLIKNYKGKFYVFTNVMAESWGDYDEKTKTWKVDNTLSIKKAAGIYDTKDEAFKNAWKLDSECGQFEEGTEYGVCFDKLIKDNTEVVLID